jgi:thioredoxin reductase (NADPH)
VVIIGGGDAALENAVILSDTAAEVTVIHRRDRFRARREFVDAAKARENVRFVLNAAVTAIHGNEQLKAISAKSLNSGFEDKTPCDYVLIRIGVEPNSELCPYAGHSGLGTSDQTSHKSLDINESIFAVGDVCKPISPTISYVRLYV